MTKYLFFDTETTGVKSTSHCLQLAGKLIDEERQRMTAFNNILYHKNVVIPQAASKVHGIYALDIRRMGINPHIVFDMFISNLMHADYLIAHNIKYDLGILLTLAKMLNKEAILSKAMKKVDLICTMSLCKPIMKMPASPAQIKAGFGPYKNPKLGEVYQSLFKKELKGAHDAMVDVNAAVRIFFELKRLYS